MNALAEKFSRSPVRRVLNLMSAREQFLLLGLLLFALWMWGSRLQEQFAGASDEFRTAHTTLAQQDSFLSDEARIEQEVAEARARVDASKTISGAQLQGEVDRLARQAGLNFSVTSPRTTSGETFNTYTVRATIRRAPIGELIEFEQSLREFAPYLRVNRVQIAASQSNPTELDAQFEIESFDLANTTG